MGRTTDALAAIATPLLIAAIVAIAIAAQRPPAPLPAGAPPHAFSAERALAHVEAIAGEPRPVGSAALREAGRYLRGRLDELGLATELQATTAVSTRFPSTALVENLLGRLPGTDPTGAILLVAHYDSVPSGPGAADNGAAVAAVLETLRAVRAGPPLRNDLLVLFSDAEEVGLLGADAFAAEHPWIDDVSLVVNLEARGSSGPSVLVETQAGNRGLIRTLGRVDGYPSANSLASALYDLLPNDTDYSIFMARGIPGFNFAFIHDAAHYHTALDDPDHLDLGSLQHHGEHLMALVGAYGGVDFAAPLLEEGDAIYFDVLRRGLVSYPAAWALPLAGVALLLVLIVVAYARARRLTRWRGVVAGAGVTVAGAAVAGGASALAFHLVQRAEPAFRVMGPVAYRPETTMAALALLAVAAFVLVAWAASRWLGFVALGLGGYLVWALLGVAVAWTLPGGSYLTTWPTLAGVAALAVVAAGRTPDTGRLSRAHVAVLLLGALPALLLIPPLVAEALQGLGLVLAGAMMAFVALAAALLLPLLPTLLGPRPLLLPAALVAIGLASLAVGARLARFDERQPAPSNAFYVVDADAGRAAFVSFMNEPDAWTSRYFVDGAVTDVRGLLPDAWAMLNAPAPVLALPAPTVTLLADEVAGSERRLTLRIASARAATQLTLLVHPDTPVDALTLDGRPVTRLERPSGWTRLVVFGRVDRAVTVELTTRATAAVELVVIDQTHDLLALDDLGVPPRPPGLMRAPSRLSDAVLVRTSWGLPPAE